MVKRFFFWIDGDVVKIHLLQNKTVRKMNTTSEYLMYSRKHVYLIVKRFHDIIFLCATDALSNLVQRLPFAKYEDNNKCHDSNDNSNSCHTAESRYPWFRIYGNKSPQLFFNTYHDIVYIEAILPYM